MILKFTTEFYPEKRNSHRIFIAFILDNLMTDVETVVNTRSQNLKFKKTVHTTFSFTPYIHYSDV